MTFLALGLGYTVLPALYLKYRKSNLAQVAGAGKRVERTTSASDYFKYIFQLLDKHGWWGIFPLIKQLVTDKYI